MKRILPLILLALAGCASEPVSVHQQAHTSLKLLPKAELLKCMGKPVKEEKGENRETLLFSGSAPDHSCPMRTYLGHTPAKRYCWVSVMLKDGRVDKVDFPPSSHGVIVTGDECGFLIEKCVQQP